uniref:hypothetical protein n=1 Tax=Candidatus Frankia nodulisporulans TaxID=2060052 RepID=UPI001583B09B
TFPSSTDSAEPAPQPSRKKSPGGPAKRPQLRKPLRTALLTLHIIVSVGWNGVAFCQLVLASTAAIDPDLRHPAYELMHVIDRTLDIPLALLTLITGVVLSVKTRWGLLRHWWIVVKLSITVVAVISGGAVIRTLIVASVKHSATAAAGYPAQTVALVVCGTVMNLLFITATVLSTTKPWGRTPRGRREARALAATPRPQPPNPHSRPRCCQQRPDGRRGQARPGPDPRPTGSRAAGQPGDDQCRPGTRPMSASDRARIARRSAKRSMIAPTGQRSTSAIRRVASASASAAGHPCASRLWHSASR